MSGGAAVAFPLSYSSAVENAGTRRRFAQEQNWLARRDCTDPKPLGRRKGRMPEAKTLKVGAFTFVKSVSMLDNAECKPRKSFVSYFSSGVRHFLREMKASTNRVCVMPVTAWCISPLTNTSQPLLCDWWNDSHLERFFRRFNNPDGCSLLLKQPDEV